MCNIYCRRNAYKANVLLLLLSSLVTQKVFAIQHWYCYRTKLQVYRTHYINTDTKIWISKMCHYVRFWQIGSHMALTVSACLFRPCIVEYWFFVDACTRHSYSKLYYLCLLCLSFCHYPPHLRTPPTHPLIYTDPIFMNSMKKSLKTGKNQPLSTCQVSCDNS